jgi:hypothetical protein
LNAARAARHRYEDAQALPDGPIGPDDEFPVRDNEVVAAGHCGMAGCTCGADPDAVSLLRIVTDWEFPPPGEEWTVDDAGRVVAVGLVTMDRGAEPRLIGRGE